MMGLHGQITIWGVGSTYNVGWCMNHVVNSITASVPSHNLCSKS